jgi:hypothetical protein
MPSSPPSGGLRSVTEVRGMANISRNPVSLNRHNSACWIAKIRARSGVAETFSVSPARRALFVDHVPRSFAYVNRAADPCRDFHIGAGVPFAVTSGPAVISGGNTVDFTGFGPHDDLTSDTSHPPFVVSSSGQYRFSAALIGEVDGGPSIISESRGRLRIGASERRILCLECVDDFRVRAASNSDPMPCV